MNIEKKFNQLERRVEAILRRLEYLKTGKRKKLSEGLPTEPKNLWHRKMPTAREINASIKRRFLNE